MNATDLVIIPALTSADNAWTLATTLTADHINTLLDLFEATGEVTVTEAVNAAHVHSDAIYAALAVDAGIIGF